ncbi:MAG TPA: hypothetical protein PK360_04030 [bacterium]|nr:hypothetical protein [bacterium]
MEEKCDEPSTAILVGASNLWFQFTITALSIPTASGQLAQRVDEYWADLSKIPSIEMFEMVRQMPHFQALDAAFLGYKSDEIWQAIQAKRQQEANEILEVEDLKYAEWEILTNPKSVPPTDYLQLHQVDPQEDYARYFSKIVLVERLREVGALIGFSRLEAKAMNPSPVTAAWR